jgi:hypothetical protein
VDPEVIEPGLLCVDYFDLESFDLDLLTVNPCAFDPFAPDPFAADPFAPDPFAAGLGPADPCTTEPGTAEPCTTDASEETPMREACESKEARAGLDADVDLGLDLDDADFDLEMGLGLDLADFELGDLDFAKYLDFNNVALADVDSANVTHHARETHMDQASADGPWNSVYRTDLSDAVTAWSWAPLGNADDAKTQTDTARCTTYGAAQFGDMDGGTQNRTAQCTAYDTVQIGDEGANRQRYSHDAEPQSAGAQTCSDAELQSEVQGTRCDAQGAAVQGAAAVQVQIQEQRAGNDETGLPAWDRPVFAK